MLIDLHVHTNISSRCSSLMPEELVDKARELGLDAVCVTEHGTFAGPFGGFEASRHVNIVPLWKDIDRASLQAWGGPSYAPLAL